MQKRKSCEDMQCADYLHCVDAVFLHPCVIHPAAQVDTSLKQLQLLYADMTEEVVSGRDYDDLLANGHLLDVEQRHHQPGATTATPAASAAAGAAWFVLAV
jgi:hypothetical protein